MQKQKAFSWSPYTSLQLLQLNRSSMKVMPLEGGWEQGESIIHLGTLGKGPLEEVSVLLRCCPSHLRGADPKKAILPTQLIINLHETEVEIIMYQCE